MIYQSAIVFNECSIRHRQTKKQTSEYEEISLLNIENTRSILRLFFHLCLRAYKLSGKENKDEYNLRDIIFVRGFCWENYLPDNTSLYNYLEDFIQDIDERDVIQGLLAERMPFPSYPDYRIHQQECLGLGYAYQNNLLSISLYTHSNWNNRILEIDKSEIIQENEDSEAVILSKKVNIRNITTIDHAFSILEEFADRFYENTYHQRPFFQPASEEYKNDFEHNLLPLKDISNQYLEYGNFYRLEENRVLSNIKDVTEIKRIAYILATLNGYTYEKKCSKLPENKRDIYSHKDHNYFITVDTAECEFEIHNKQSENNHKGSFSFDCQRQKGKKKNRKITPC